jgi:hypothetical protein
LHVSSGSWRWELSADVFYRSIAILTLPVRSNLCPARLIRSIERSWSSHIRFARFHIAGSIVVSVAIVVASVVVAILVIAMMVMVSVLAATARRHLTGDDLLV